MAEDTRNLLERLRDFRNDVPTIGFDRDVKAGARRYSYVTLGKLVDLVTPVLNQHGLILTQVVAPEGVLTMLSSISDDSAPLTCLVPVTFAGLNSQEVGSAITYSRRYGIVTILGLVPEEDDDGAVASNRAPVQTARQAAPAHEAAPEAAEGWNDSKQSATAHTLLSDRIGKLDAAQRSICSQYREANGGWPLAKDKFDELSAIVTTMEAGLVSEDSGGTF